MYTLTKATVTVSSFPRSARHPLVMVTERSTNLLSAAICATRIRQIPSSQ